MKNIYIYGGMRLDGFFAGEFLERTEAWQFELQTGSWLNVGLYIPIVLLLYPYEGSVFRHPQNLLQNPLAEGVGA